MKQLMEQAVKAQKTLVDTQLGYLEKAQEQGINGFKWSIRGATTLLEAQQAATQAWLDLIPSESADKA